MAAQAGKPPAGASITSPPFASRSYVVTGVPSSATDASSTSGWPASSSAGWPAAAAAQRAKLSCDVTVVTSPKEKSSDTVWMLYGTGA